MDGQDPQQNQQDQGGQPTPPPSQGQQAGGAGQPTPPPAQTGQTGDQDAQAEPKKQVNDEEIGLGSAGDFTTSIQIPPHNLNFDEAYFLKLMAGSISLMKEEKIKIIESVPKLTQYQVDDLIRILEEERRKFAELDDKHQAKVGELQKKQEDDWKALEMKKQEEAEKSKTEEEAAKLREQISGGSAPSNENPQNDQPNQAA